MKKYLFTFALIVLHIPSLFAQNNKTSDKTDAKNQKQGENMKNILIAYFSLYSWVIQSGGGKRPKLYTHFWKVMIFREKQLYLSVHREAAR